MGKESLLRLRVEEAEPEVAVELPEAGRSAAPRFAGPIEGWPPTESSDGQSSKSSRSAGRPSRVGQAYRQRSAAAAQ
jgi:hypothetical protein